MGRSKFPGKPSKHTNRKRINVLPPNGEVPSNHDSVTVGEDKQPPIQNEPDITASTTVDIQTVSQDVPAKEKEYIKKKIQTSKKLRNKTTKRMISRMCSKNVIKAKMKRTKNGKNIACKRFSTLNTIPRGSPRETGNLGKFILPSRSVHSSRVIKPNKRFLDINESLTRKQQRINKRAAERNEQKSIEDIKTSDDISQTSCSNRRIILRQARLQFHYSQSYPQNSQGPFSSTSSNSSAPGTVTCGVCGAVRFYRFIKQARKFNIYSCESCRKFISKMIKRQSCKGFSLVCHKGQGTCHVPPIVRSQQLIKCAYRARCPACWLKMCLRSFQIPVNLRNRLSQFLPPYMQTDSVFGNNSLFWSSTIKSIDVDINKAIATSSEDKATTASRPLRSNNSITTTTSTSVNTNPVNNANNSEIKRQKVDLKGPRVKHVCRSASIVLGQPVATFENKAESNQSSDETSKEEKEVKTDTTFSESESIEGDKFKPVSFAEPSVSHARRDRSHRITTQLSIEEKTQDKNRQNQLSQHSISIDFWENYDPEDVNQNGFSLISSDKFPMPSICFLCGSAGLEALLHCSACCEPYHPFCLEQIPQLGTYNMKQSMWLCPRCTVCSFCNSNERTKVNCQKCYKAYHMECMNYGFKWSGEDALTVCAKCLRCKSCGTESITKFVGNLPLCLTCLKLRKKGNFCPLCQKCYYENDFCSKMMECANCNKWVHSKCEGLLEEHYQILSLLPESTEYICRLCSKSRVPYWRKAVDSELKASFHNVLRLLSKNKVARNLLKWSPLNNNNNTTHSKAITTVRKIQFNEQDQSIDIRNNNEVKTSNVRTMLDIKNKLLSNDYYSVREYDKEMQEALIHTKSDELIDIYRSILHSVFPWYETSMFEESDSEMQIETHTEALKKVEKMELNFTPQIELISGKDTRVCGFCKNVGDGFNDQESRLLYCGQNEWVHANCALWSSEVYEEIDGSLQNVHSALSRGRLIKCAVCKQKGASVGCCFKSCFETYHFICARNVNCTFLHDKTVFCSSHELLSKSSNIITCSQDFEIRRSVYVELDKRKGKFCLVDKVNFMVGSLCVTNLGKINPILSDGYNAIIPIGFTCSRLFWSTVEPWKLVCYTITTSANTNSTSTILSDKNFTIDHTLSKSAVERKFKELNVWQKDLEKRKSESIDLDDEEEPQNPADILSPELTDAILKELPNDLLDGISVQDIIPKLMPFEDLQSMDEIINTDEYGRELKRCLSDKSQQRSCSVTLSCKMDRSISPVLKKRKVIPPHENLFFKLLQVDGNFDDDDSQLMATSWRPNEEPVTCEKCQCTYRTQASYKRHLDNCELLCTSESDSELVESNSFQETRLTTINTQVDSSILNIENAQPIVINSYQNQLHTYVKTKSSQIIAAAPSNTNSEIIHNQPTIQCNLPILNQNGDNMQNSSSLIQNNFCVNSAVPLCVNQSVPLQTINQIGTPTVTVQQPIEFQQPVTIQQVPFATSQVINIGAQNQIINGKIMNSMVTQPVNQWIKPISKPQDKIVKCRPRQKTIISKVENELMIQNPAPVIVQQIPSANFVPTFVDASSFQQQTGQNVQYIATISPQIQGQVVQIQPENNLISLVPGMQSVIIQQPRLVENQLIMDSNGTISWAPTPQPVQPVYYGFETIVQNTVMQSQQFLPTTVPGVLTANSSYSTTTQVFQTSKLEPVLDVSSNGFLLVNPSQLMAPEIPRYSQQPMKAEEVQQQQQQVKYSIVATNSHQKSSQFIQQPINLPTAPFVQEQRIPTNVVTPTPKPVQAVQTRPMNRVLPMQTAPVKQDKLQKMSTDFQKSIEQQKTLLQSSDFQKPPLKSPEFQKPPLLSPDFQKPPQLIDVQKTVFQQQQEFQKPTLKSPGYQKPPLASPEFQKPLPLQSSDILKSPTQRDDFDKPKLPLPNSLSTVVFSNQIADFQKLIPKPVDIQKTQLQPKDFNKQVIEIQSAEIHKPITNYCDPLKSPVNVQSTILCDLNQGDEKNSPLMEIQKTVDSLVSHKDKQQNMLSTSEILSMANEQLSMSNIRDLQKANNQFSSKQPIFDSLPSLQIKQESPELNKVEKLINEKSADDLFDSLLQEQRLQEKNQKENIIDSKNDSLRIVFQKQSRDGTYKISNNYSSKSANVQVAPLKPIKSNSSTQPLSQINNKMSSTQIPKFNYSKKEKKSLASNEPLKTSQDKKGDSQTILYTIETQDGFRYSSTSVSELWAKVFEAVQKARAAHKMPPLPEQSLNVISNLQVLGLKNNGLKYLLEQLPGVQKCSKYKPVHHFPTANLDLEDDYAVGHSLGAIRCVPHTKRYNHYDMFGWLSSKHRSPESALVYDMDLPRRGSINNLPMAMRFRNLKLTSKLSVGVYRSNIHGRGLFCLRDIEAGEMVIEYAGEVIRSILCDKREKEYNQKGIGCYMFRIDDNLVVDATMKGNAARFINHSCDPNCYSKVVEILGHKHIIIFALRRIMYSEELTYDYKFPFEEDKIPCTCGTRRCRKFLN